MEEVGFALFVGVDWATQEHYVCVTNATGQVLKECSIEHQAHALHEFADWLIEQAGGQASRVAVAIEVPHGVVVETLLERGLVVYSINPKQLDRFRDRFTAAGAKDDRRDARVLADSLRTDRRAFRLVVLGAAQLVALREESRLHDELGRQLVQLSNRLRDQLRRYYPQLLAVGGADEPWLWELWEMAPTPEQAGKLKSAQVEKLLRRCRIRRHTAKSVLELLKVTAFVVAPGVTRAACRHIEVLLPQLRLLTQQQRCCKKELSSLLESCKARADHGDSAPRCEYSDAEILLSLPGVGDLLAATILAEAGQALTERDLTTLRTLCGSAPVTKRSGKSLVVVRRYACNQRLQNACHHWAQSAVAWDASSAAHYAQLRARGHKYGRALRGVVDRLLSVLIAMLRDRTLYDPTRRHAARAAA
jgi:transposase